MGNRGDLGDAGQEPDQNGDPNPNPSGRKGTDRVNSIPAESSVAQDKMDPKVDQLLKSKDLGSLNRDERRRHLDSLGCGRPEGIRGGAFEQISDGGCLANPQQKRRSSTGDTATPLAEKDDCVPSGSAHLDVQLGDYGPRSPVRNNRCSHDHRCFYPHGRVGVPFSGIYRLRRDCCDYHVPCHHLDDLRPDLRNP